MEKVARLGAQGPLAPCSLASSSPKLQASGIARLQGPGRESEHSTPRIDGLPRARRLMRALTCGDRALREEQINAIDSWLEDDFGSKEKLSGRPRRPPGGKSDAC